MRNEGQFDPGREEREPGREPSRRAGASAKLVLAVLVALLLVTFAAANFKPVEVNFLLFTTRARVVTVIAVSALLGFLVGWLAGRSERSGREALRRKG
jgi:uncharacterized integral membrane protein